MRPRIRRGLARSCSSLLAEQEQMVDTSACWAARPGERRGLLLLGRRRHLAALTTRRLLLFRPSGLRRGVRAEDLVLAKRYASLRIDAVHTARLLLQVQLTSNAGRLVLEFRPNARATARALVTMVDTATAAARRESLSPASATPA